jgi:lipopolysaccharide/colanic/teichoic acid biosynthesis glycosyltransferase
VKGFVQKNGRLTKGGSLPLTVGARRLGRFFLRYISQENGSNGTAAPRATEIAFFRRFDSTRHHNGSRPEFQNKIGPSRNGGTSNGNECPPFLQKLMVDLVSSEHDEESRSISSGNGNGHRSVHSSNGTTGHSQLAPSWEQPSAFGTSCNDVAPIFLPTWKRVLDLTCVALTLPCWLPLMILVMLWIRLVSPGPIFFRQARIGHRRRHFMIFKFRTMRVNAETQTHAEYFAHLMKADCPMTKLDHGDPRLIAFGRFLRATGLDELPQIFNVIWGDMSLVGPRPCLPHEFESYEIWQQQRVNVLPGLTGYWQVNGKNHTTFSEMIAMDIFYSRNMSLRLDLAIILKTIPALVTQTLESRALSRVQSRRQLLPQTHR